MSNARVESNARCHSNIRDMSNGRKRSNTRFKSNSRMNSSSRVQSNIRTNATAEFKDLSPTPETDEYYEYEYDYYYESTNRKVPTPENSISMTTASKVKHPEAPMPMTPSSKVPTSESPISMTTSSTLKVKHRTTFKDTMQFMMCRIIRGHSPNTVYSDELKDSVLPKRLPIENTAFQIANGIGREKGDTAWIIDPYDPTMERTIKDTKCLHARKCDFNKVRPAASDPKERLFEVFRWNPMTSTTIHRDGENRKMFGCRCGDHHRKQTAGLTAQQMCVIGFGYHACISFAMGLYGFSYLGLKRIENWMWLDYVEIIPYIYIFIMGICNGYLVWWGTMLSKGDADRITRMRDTAGAVQKRSDFRRYQLIRFTMAHNGSFLLLTLIVILVQILAVVISNAHAGTEDQIWKYGNLIAIAFLMLFSFFLHSFGPLPMGNCTYLGLLSLFEDCDQDEKSIKTSSLMTAMEAQTYLLDYDYDTVDSGTESEELQFVSADTDDDAIFASEYRDARGYVIGAVEEDDRELHIDLDCDAFV